MTNALSPGTQKRGPRALLDEQSEHAPAYKGARLVKLVAGGHAASLWEEAKEA